MSVEIIVNSFTDCWHTLYPSIFCRHFTEEKLDLLPEFPLRSSQARHIKPTFFFACETAGDDISKYNGVKLAPAQFVRRRLKLLFQAWRQISWSRTPPARNQKAASRQRISTPKNPPIPPFTPSSVTTSPYISTAAMLVSLGAALLSSAAFTAAQAIDPQLTGTWSTKSNSTFTGPVGHRVLTIESLQH